MLVISSEVTWVAVTSALSQHELEQEFPTIVSGVLVGRGGGGRGGLGFFNRERRDESGEAPMQQVKSLRDRMLVPVSVVCAAGLLSVIAARGWMASRGPTEIEPADRMVCLLVNQNSGRCLSVEGSKREPGVKIVQGPTPDLAGTSEHWILLKKDDAYRLQNENSQQVLEIPGSNKSKGVQAIQWRDGGKSENQQWVFERVGKSFVLRVRHSQQVLSIGQGALTEGAPAVQWDYVPNVQDQVWDLVPVSR